jgi:hypothetical protein
VPSVIDLCNSALDKVGQGAITSLGDNTKSSKLCNRNWPLVRDRVLRAHPWNFAVRRTNLAPDSIAPSWGFTAKFPIPTDCLRLLEVRDLSTGEFQLENGYIHANATVLYIRYISRIEDPNVYDSLFVNSAATLLAAEVCEPFDQSASKKKGLLDEYDAFLAEAKGADAQENPPTVYEEDDWIKVRY